MNPYFTAQFKTESDHSAFLNWLPAWERENGFDTESKIRFIRCDGIFSVWTVQCTDANLQTLQNAAAAFNAHVE